MAFIQAVEISLLSGVAGFALTMLASLVRAPKLLNDQRLSDIKTRDEENRRLRNEIETDRARLARAAQINPDFRLGVDASAKDKVFMNLSGLPHPVALPVIFLTVVNRSQTHFEVVRYCLHKLGKPLREFDTDLIVSPAVPERVPIQLHLIDVICEGATPEYTEICTEHHVPVSIECRGEHSNNAVMSDSKAFDVLIERTADAAVRSGVVPHREN